GFGGGCGREGEGVARGEARAGAVVGEAGVHRRATECALRLLGADRDARRRADADVARAPRPRTPPRRETGRQGRRARALATGRESRATRSRSDPSRRASWPWVGGAAQRARTPS